MENFDPFGFTPKKKPKIPKKLKFVNLIKPVKFTNLGKPVRAIKSQVAVAKKSFTDKDNYIVSVTVVGPNKNKVNSKASNAYKKLLSPLTPRKRKSTRTPSLPRKGKYKPRIRKSKSPPKAPKKIKKRIYKYV